MYGRLVVFLVVEEKRGHAKEKWGSAGVKVASQIPHRMLNKSVVIS